MTRRTKRRIVFAASAAFGIAQPAEGTLVIRLRATSVSGPATIVNPHLVHITGAGAVINMDLVADIEGGNATITDDGFISAPFTFGSYEDVPPAQTLRGPMVAHRGALMMGPNSSDGMQTDLDGDGDLDVDGGFFAVSNDAPLPIFGMEILVAHASFTVDDYLGPGSNSLIANVDWRAPQWMEDGQLRDGTNGFVWGTPWVVASAVAVPEPISLLLTSVATFASALRPRRHAR